MGSPLVFAIIVASGILLSSVLLPFQLNVIYADESETNTEQGLALENVGSGESTNFNCSQNAIDSLTTTLTCGDESATPTPPPNIPPDREPFGLALPNCRILPVDSRTNVLQCEQVNRRPTSILSCTVPNPIPQGRVTLTSCYYRNTGDFPLRLVECEFENLQNPSAMGATCRYIGFP